MTPANANPARVGRERGCAQCGTPFRSPRSSALYCAPACRQKAHRGTAPTSGPKAGPAAWGILPKALFTLGLVGQIGPVSGRSSEPPVYGLLVDCAAAHDDLADVFNRKGWGVISRAEFDSALRADGIRPFSSRGPEAAEGKRWQDRQRQRLNRSA